MKIKATLIYHLIKVKAAIIIKMENRRWGGWRKEACSLVSWSAGYYIAEISSEVSQKIVTQLFYSGAYVQRTACHTIKELANPCLLLIVFVMWIL